MRQNTSDNQSFLSQSGVDLAKKIGQKMQQTGRTYALVVTSALNRAIQTPIAMGYAVDYINALFSTNDPLLEAQLDKMGLSYTSRFVELRSALQEGTGFENYGKVHCEAYKVLLDQVNEGETVLLVSHGGVVEFPLISMFPEADYQLWGSMFDYCEGYRVGFEGDQFTNLELLRND